MGTSQTLSGNMTTTTTTATIVLALLITLSHSHPFFLRRNQESLSSRSSNQTEDESGLTQDTILGVFDTVTGLTYGLGGLFQQFEEGFQKIRPQSDTTVTNKVFHNVMEEEEEDTNIGSSAVVGLFDSLRNLNRHVGKLVDRVGDTLTDRRDNVVRLASNLDSGLKNVGEGFHDWRQENFGISLRRKKVTQAEDGEDGKDGEDGEDAAEEAEDVDNEVEDIVV